MTTKQKQWQLYYLGFYEGQIDGLWGKQSQAAAIEFQRAFDLPVTGLFREEDEKKSMELIRELQKTVTHANPTPLIIDGLAGKYTMAATIRYQKDQGLTPDGIAGKQTRAHIDEETSEDFWDRIQYFARAEFACKCGSAFCDGFPAEPSRKLVRLAEEIRKFYGVPVIVSSGVRCVRHNANVGGVANSRHLSGKAMDFCVRGKPASRVLAYVKTLPVRYAYPIDENYVHMDV